MAIGDTYTSQYGGTSQGTSLQSLLDAFGGIQGMAQVAKVDPAYAQAQQLTMQAPQAIFNTQKQLIGQSGIPQLQAGQQDLGKLFQMYLADQQASAKYAAPSAPSAVPTMQDYINLAQNPSQATLPDLTKGFTVPSVIGQAQQAVPDAAQSLINTLTQGISGQEGMVKDYTGVASQNYQAAINALLGLSNRQDQLRSQALEQAKLGLEQYKAGVPGALGGAGQVAIDYADGFMGGLIKWGDIPKQYKNAVTTVVKDRGGKVEDTIDKYRAIENTNQIIDQIEETYKKMGTAEKHIPDQLAQLAPGIAPNKAKILSLFYTNLEGELRKATVGGRITQQEVNWVRGAVLPGPLDTATSAKAKLDALRSGLQQKAFDPSYVLGSGQY